MPENTAKPTPLTERHQQLGARLVPFAGYLMPLQYSGQRAEHEAVRSRLGIFDLSHMGELRIRGPRALEAVDRLVTNRVTGTEPGQAVYSPMCRPDGGIVDDLIVYHLPDSVLLVVNASNIAKDAAWIREHLPSHLEMVDESDDTALIAVQGPPTEAFLQERVSVSLNDMETYTAKEGTVDGVPALISRTGYTGEDGFELYVRAGDANQVWDGLLAAGKGHDMAPIGLAARDTLRFEMGYCLYGNDIDDTTNPLEAGLGWTVKLKKDDFVGKDRLVEVKAEGLRRRLVGLVPDAAKSIPRKDYPVLCDNAAVGRVTSGTFSPSLERGLAMGYVPAECAAPGDRVDIDIRGKAAGASVSRPPFYKEGSRKAAKKRT